MKYEDFEKFVRELCQYETIYYDSEGRLMLIIQMLEAYSMLNKAAVPTTLINVNGVLEQAGYVKKKEWQGLTKEELAEISEFHFHGAFSGRDFYEDIETRLKEKNT